MVKKKPSKKKELVIMIRIPDVDDRQGVGTLAIQRGELGHLQQFDYKGLTLKGNIAEAVGTALLKLVQVEAAPPPDLPAADTENSASVNSDSLPDEAEEDENPSEMAENPPSNPPIQSVSGETAITDTDDTLQETHTVKPAQSPEKVSVSVGFATTDTLTNNQQIAMF
ncbi:MAG: hypothetical protein K8I82_26645 [Anaerolineae bacterium]|nr:hypothetical protein [Anaerolineae bacterium]